MKTTTLVILSSNRGDKILSDQLAALAWTMQRSFYTLIRTTIQPRIQLPANSEVFLEADGDPGYRPGVVLAAVIREGMQFQQVLVMDDLALPIGIGLDTWFVENAIPYSSGLLGVRDDRRFDIRYGNALSRLAALGLPVGADISHETVHDAFYMLSGVFAQELFARALLSPDGYEDWPLPYGAYISWVTQLLEQPQVGWGSSARPLAPLYLNQYPPTKTMPAPQILSEEFKLYYPVSPVLMSSELEIRDHYRRKRAEG